MFEIMKFMFINLFVVIMMTSCLSDTFTTYKCDDKYLHVYYGGGVGGYRLVILNDRESMVFAGISDYEKYKQDNTPKLVYENDNSIFIKCDDLINIVTDSQPLKNTILDSVLIEVLEPAQLIDIDTTKYDIVIR